LYLSHDRGVNFGSAPAQADWTIRTVALSADVAHAGRLFVGAVPASSAHDLLARSSDSGRSFDLTRGQLFGATNRVDSVIASLPDGRIIIGSWTPTSDGEFGLRCSKDQGLTWSQTC